MGTEINGKILRGVIFRINKKMGRREEAGGQRGRRRQQRHRDSLSLPFHFDEGGLAEAGAGAVRVAPSGRRKQEGMRRPRRPKVLFRRGYAQRVVKR